MEKKFHRLIALHESPTLSFEEVFRETPFLPKGWYELSRLPKEDRIEFTRDFWFSQLPIPSEKIEKKFELFFEQMEDIGIFLTQDTKNAPFEAHMVYSLKETTFHYHGSPGADLEKISTLIKQFGQFNLPVSYLSFLKVHDGFSRYEDSGMIRTKEMPRAYQGFQKLIAQETLFRADGQSVDPTQLIPFYEATELHAYQCFYADWYPDEEMGAVFFSAADRTISNFLDENNLVKNKAFPSFMIWLSHYLDATYEL